MNYLAIPGLKFRPRSIPARGFINSDRIINIVLNHFDLSFAQISRKTRYQNIVYPRHVLIYILSKNTNLTLKGIGEMFHKDHTTVMHSIKVIEERMATEDCIKFEIMELEDSI